MSSNSTLAFWAASDAATTKKAPTSMSWQERIPPPSGATVGMERASVRMRLRRRRSPESAQGADRLSGGALAHADGKEGSGRIRCPG